MIIFSDCSDTKLKFIISEVCLYLVTQLKLYKRPRKRARGGGGGGGGVCLVTQVKGLVNKTMGWGSNHIEILRF